MGQIFCGLLKKSKVPETQKIHTHFKFSLLVYHETPTPKPLDYLTIYSIPFTCVMRRSTISTFVCCNLVYFGSVSPVLGICIFSDNQSAIIDISSPEFNITYVITWKKGTILRQYATSQFVGRIVSLSVRKICLPISGIVTGILRLHNTPVTFFFLFF